MALVNSFRFIRPLRLLGRGLAQARGVRRDRSAPPCRIVLHIGRHTAGSTTVGDFCHAGRAELRAQGVDYVMFQYPAGGEPDAPGCRTFEELLAYAEAQPDGLRVLVSNEFMLSWPEVFTAAAARALAGAEVQVLAYLRPYDAWAVSAYAEETRRGMNMRDIDEYVDWLWPRISAWPDLKAWGEGFGWGRLRIRNLSAKALQGGGVTSDFVQALGLAPIANRAPQSGGVPHWLELELTRRLAERNGEQPWFGVRQAEVEPLLAELRPLICGAPSTAYLSLSQRRHLTNLYNEDLARILAAGGPRLAEAKFPSGEERRFVPSFADAPREVLRSFFQRTGSASFAKAYPDAAERAQRLKAELERARSRRVA